MQSEPPRRRRVRRTPLTGLGADDETATGTVARPDRSPAPSTRSPDIASHDRSPDVALRNQEPTVAPIASGGPVASEDLDAASAERGLRGLVGSGASQVRSPAAMRARDAARPRESDLARAAAELTIVRRHWAPPAGSSLPRD
jgi:hypothetical protein